MKPGVMGISDFTELKGVAITIHGQPFEHLLYHYRLAYSGWRYAQVIQGGESFIALSEGLQNALFESGGAPQEHRTDSLSAAYRNTGGKGRKPLTRLYDDLCHHYRLEADAQQQRDSPRKWRDRVAPWTSQKPHCSSALPARQH
jgi:hypothetical protein